MLIWFKYLIPLTCLNLQASFWNPALADTRIFNLYQLTASAWLWSAWFHSPDDIHSLYHFTKNNMSIIQPVSFVKTDKELTSISVWPSIRHWKNTSSSVFHFEILISKFFAINWITTSPVTFVEVSALKLLVSSMSHRLWPFIDLMKAHLTHETRNDSMKDTSFISKSFRPSGQGSEIFRRFWNSIVKEDEFYSTGCFSIDWYVKENVLTK